MPSGKQPVNCVPCAKRKVRCNRFQPCSHCQRRKGDVCIYPVQRSKGHQLDRLEKLELYVRRLGGDPESIDQDEYTSTSIDDTNTSDEVSARVHSVNETASPGPNDIQRTNGLATQKSGLIDHNEQVTYIQLPMWYSWNGVKIPGDNPQDLDAAQIKQAKPTSKGPHAFSTLFDPLSLPDNLSLHSVYPSMTESTILWKTYLENVHPLVMIFFDWETEVIVAKAAQRPTELKEGEQALAFGVYFIATLSLSERACLDVLHVRRSYLLDKFQKAVEDSLLIAELLVTSDRLVLQAFMLYLLAMRNRARPAAIFSLTGIASRIAERIGLHRDGTTLSLSHLRSEERRRMWWQLQHMELSAAQLTGSVTMTIYAEWDTALPLNLSDDDFYPDMVDLPPERPGLTMMSHCLWRYQILHMQRESRQPEGVVGKGLSWMLSPQIPLSDKDAGIDAVEKVLGEKFLQHCEPLIPLHVHIQIGVRAFILAARWVARQPALINARISQMSVGERDDLLRICMKSLEYYVLGQKTEMLRKYSWHAYNYFQWAVFVYTILEAHHRPPEAITDDLWSLISNIYSVHPTLGNAIHHPDIACIVHITLAAYQKRHVDILQRYRLRKLNHNFGQLDPPTGSRSGYGPELEPHPPQWIQDLKQKLNLSEMTEPSTLFPESTAAASESKIDDAGVGLLPSDFDFDFDMIDWKFWENAGLDAVV